MRRTPNEAKEPVDSRRRARCIASPKPKSREKVEMNFASARIEINAAVARSRRPAGANEASSIAAIGRAKIGPLTTMMPRRAKPLRTSTERIRSLRRRGPTFIAGISGGRSRGP